MRTNLANSKYYLNIRSGYSAPVTVHCSYGDSGETVTLYLFDGNNSFDLTGSFVSIHGTRKDGANFGPFECVADGNAVSFEIQPSMTAVEGGCIAEFTITKNGTTIGSCNFGIMVEKAVFPNGVSYDTDPSVYQNILAFVQEIPSRITFDFGQKIDNEKTARIEAIEAERSARIAGDAANANAIAVEKARLDNYIESGTAAADGELVDIRVGADGKTYSDAGTAVRTIETNLESGLPITANTLNPDVLESATQIIDIGTAKQNTVITASTGIERTAGANNWCTADYIPVPEAVIYITSRTVDTGGASFGIIGYDGFKRRVADIHGETGLAVGTESFDNRNYKFKYIRLNLYSSSGYTAAKHNQVDVYYFFDIYKRNNILQSLKIGHNTVNVSSDTATIAYSPNRIGMEEFAYADKPIQIINNASSNLKYGVVVAASKNSAKVAEGLIRTSDGWLANAHPSASIIPSGTYYSIAFALNDDANTIKLSDAIDSSYIKIYELDDGEVGIASFGTNGAISSTEQNRAMIPKRFYAYDNIYLKAKPGYVFTSIEYDDGSETGKSFRGDYSVTEAFIPKDCYYRYSVGLTGSTAGSVTQENKDAVYAGVERYVLADVTERIAKQMYGLEEYISKSNERIAALEALNNINVVPSHYETHIAAKAETINALRNATDNCTQFFFITDVHINSYRNYKHSKALLNYLCKNTTVDKIFNGGDLYNAGTGLSEDVVVNAIREGITYTQPDYNCKQYFVMGNHDTGYDWVESGSDIVEYGPMISTEHLYRIAGIDNHLLALETDYKGRSNYYFDDGDYRFIVSNAGLNGFTGESTGGTWRFICDALANAGNKKIIIVQHIMWQSNSDTDFLDRAQGIADVADQYNARSIGDWGGNAKRDFSNCTGEVVCIVCGHLHTDRSTYTAGGIPVIAVTTDNAEAEHASTYASRNPAEGTIKEQAFDAFTIDVTNRKVYATRIGFGDDRVFDFPPQS